MLLAIDTSRYEQILIHGGDIDTRDITHESNNSERVILSIGKKSNLPLVGWDKRNRNKTQEKWTEDVGRWRACYNQIGFQHPQHWLLLVGARHRLFFKAGLQVNTMRLCQGGRLICPPSRRVRPSSAAGLQSDLCLGQSATWHSLDRPDQEIDSIKANGKLWLFFHPYLLQ